ncbi:hypothetical protein E2562_001119 [Oryza meyeriana var. granulata]|uniref:Uncharacterized protein n=1 Tax=Oryza meyeriana var. granulata TaxID=110450 RepID=A0A6G1EDA5_9ORYZ|nr:hypothetical protein E2562_001119 [Oryza meyeriana var. granulata]
MFEVYQLLRAIGEKYHFSAEDDLMLPPLSTDEETLDELIVAQMRKTERQNVWIGAYDVCKPKGT